MFNLQGDGGDVAVSTLTDDNKADGYSGKQLVWISAYGHTSVLAHLSLDK